MNPTDEEICKILGWEPEGAELKYSRGDGKRCYEMFPSRESAEAVVHLYPDNAEVIDVWPSVTTDDAIAVKAMEELERECGLAFSISNVYHQWAVAVFTDSSVFDEYLDASFPMAVCKAIKAEYKEATNNANT